MRREAARPGHLAADHQHVPAVVFVLCRLRPGVALQPQSGLILPQLRANSRQHRVGDADIRQLYFPAIVATRQQQVPWFLAEKRDGRIGLDRRAHHRTGIAVDPAGDIDGDDIELAAVDRLDHLPRFAGNRAAEARAEQRVDNQSLAIQQARR